MTTIPDSDSDSALQSGELNSETPTVEREREREIVRVTKWDWDSQQLHNWPGPLGVRI